MEPFKLAALESFLRSQDIPYYTPDSAEYAAVSSVFTPGNLGPGRPRPPAIARPRSAADVAALVTHCAASGTDFTVRAGGHDCLGRSLAADALALDVRDIRHVRVADDGRSACAGGGVLMADLLGRLQERGVTAAAGSMGSVGYVGWATLGGYGLYAPSYGLGVDQILGATVVDARGEIVTASDEMLRGLRGGGAGNFGVVVEVTIKVYPWTEIQDGAIIMESSDLSATTSRVLTNLNALRAREGLPPELALMPGIFNLPQTGPALLLCFCWNGPESADSRRWLSLVRACGPAAGGQVTTTSPARASRDLCALVPARLFGHPETVSLARLSPAAVAVLAAHAARMPRAPGVVLNIHELRGPSCAAAGPPSVFACREPHFVVEIIGMAETPAAAAAAQRWAAALRDELARVSDALEQTYYSLTGPAHLDLGRIYGDKLGELEALKNKFDPKRVFKHAVPSIQ